MNRETILLCTGLPPLKVAELLADVLGATMNIDCGVPIVRRPVTGEYSDRASVGGGVYSNYLREEDPEPDDQSIYDASYDILYKVAVTRSIPGDVRAQLQADQARRIFTEITERLAFPAAHTEEGGLLYSAWDPELGCTDFPPDTTSYAEHHDLWEPYAHPSAPNPTKDHLP